MASKVRTRGPGSYRPLVQKIRYAAVPVVENVMAVTLGYWAPLPSAAFTEHGDQLLGTVPGGLFLLLLHASPGL
jgi:hypothetical protein